MLVRTSTAFRPKVSRVIATAFSAITLDDGPVAGDAGADGRSFRS